MKRAFLILAACLVTSTLPAGNSGSLTPEGVGYVLHAGAANSTIADATVIYFGSLPSQPPVATAALTRIYVPQAGTIRKVFLYITSGITPTSETSIIALRLNDSTDTVIVADAVLVTGSNPFSNVALNIQVVQGDFFEIKWTPPTWATNPTSVRPSALIYIE